MTLIKGKVQIIEEKTNEEKGSKYFLLTMYDKQYNAFYINITTLPKDLKEGKNIQATCYSSNNSFYNLVEDKITILNEDNGEVVSDLNVVIDNVIVVDMIENKEKIKSLVLMTSKNKIIKVKIENSEKVDKSKILQQLKGKKVNINYTSSFYAEKTKTNYIKTNSINNIKIANKEA